MESLSSDEAGILGSQEDEASSDLGWLTWTAHWRGELLLSRAWHGRWDEWSPDWSWADGVDTDALGQLLVGQSAGESDDGSLGGGVIEEIWATDVVVDRGAGDDGVAAGHVWDEVLGEEEEWVDVDVEGVDPLLLRAVGDVLLDHLGAVVKNQDVDSAHQLSGLIGDGLALLLVLEVRLNEVELATLLLDKTFGLLGILLLLWEVDNGGLGSFHGVEDSNGTSDTRVSTSDQSLAAHELLCSNIWLESAVDGWELVIDGLLGELAHLSWDGVLAGDWNLVVCRYVSMFVL